MRDKSARLQNINSVSLNSLDSDSEPVEVRKESHAIKLVSFIDITDSFTYPSIVARTPANLRTIRPTTLKLLNQQITLEVKHAEAAEFEEAILLDQ
jgi:hypothetical protein